MEQIGNYITNTTQSQFAFKTDIPFETRAKQSAAIKHKHPTRVPIVVEPHKKDKGLILDKKKYLVPKDLSVGQFIYVLRKRMVMEPNKALYLFMEDETIPSTADVLSNLYKENVNDDGFLYITISEEMTFG